MAVAAALISTESGVEVGAKTCFFGELGLTGEVRAVPFADLRLREAEKLGFERFIVPASNKRRLEELPAALLNRCSWMRDARDLFELFDGPGNGQSGVRRPRPPYAPRGAAAAAEPEAGQFD